MIPKEYELVRALKDESFTLKMKEHYIHSKYNPIMEGKKISSSINFSYAPDSYFCFLGLGLAYHVESFINENQNVNLILVEPDIFFFPILL